MKTITSLDIWIPAILVNNKKDILLTLAIWNDEEKEPVFYAGKAGPYFLSDLCDKKGIPLNEYVWNVNGRWTAKFISPNIVLLKPVMSIGIKQMIFTDIIQKLKADP